jgi:hypothetical protein
MKIGDRYANRKTARVAKIVGLNDRYVEYQYEKTDDGNKRLKMIRTNTACVVTEQFNEMFEKTP